MCCFCFYVVCKEFGKLASQRFYLNVILDLARKTLKKKQSNEGVINVTLSCFTWLVLCHLCLNNEYTYHRVVYPVHIAIMNKQLLITIICYQRPLTCN